MDSYFCQTCYAEDRELFYLCRRSPRHVFCAKCIGVKRRQALVQKTHLRCPCCNSLVQKYENLREDPTLDEITNLLQNLSMTTLP